MIPHGTRIWQSQMKELGKADKMMACGDEFNPMTDPARELQFLYILPACTWHTTCGSTIHLTAEWITASA
jgi:hypothetical protein